MRWLYRCLVLGLPLFAACGSRGTAAAPPPAAPSLPSSEATNNTAIAPATKAVETVAGASKWIGGAAASKYLLADLEDQLVGVWVDVPEARAGKVPMAITLAVDTSGSMAGANIRRARDAAKELIRQMSDGDVVTVVAFNDNAEEIVPPTTLNDRTRAGVGRAIDQLVARGATNLEEGLAVAEERTLDAPKTHLVRRIVLISDGKATVGAASPGVLGALAERGATHGVSVTSIGVGLDYDEATLNALAVQSSGRLYHLASGGELAAILEREMGLLVQTTATNAEVEIVPAPGVKVVRVEGVRSYADATAVRVPLGAMFSGQRRELLVRVRIDDGAEGERPLASVRLRYEDPLDSGVPRIQEVVVRATLTHDEQTVAANAQPRSRSIIAMHHAADLAESASRLLDGGDADAAERELGMAFRSLEDAARDAVDEADRQRVTAAAERVSAARRAVSDVKASPRKTRAARAGVLMLNDVAMDAWGY